MALEIIKDPTYGIRHFVSSLTVAGNDYSSSFNSDGTNYPVGYDFEDGLRGWIKSPSNAFNAEIQTNGSYTWMNWNQYGYQGGRLTKSYPEILEEISTTFYLPEYTVGSISGDVGLKFKTLTGQNAVKVAIDRNSIEVLEWNGTAYESLWAVDTSATPTGTEIALTYNKVAGIVSLYVEYPATILNLSYAHDIQTVEFFSENGNNYPLTLQYFYLDALAGEQRNLNLAIPPQLASEYVAGDVLIVSSHEGSDYGGDSMLPRISGQFTALSPVKDVSIGAVGFQRFWARTLTSNEPLLYQFTRGDSNSLYDSPKLIGFIVRGAPLEDLTVLFSDAVTGENTLQLIASNSCNAAQGDLVYGYVHNESNYDQMYTVVPTQDFLWYQTFPHGVTSLREAEAGDDGITRFQNILSTFDYRVFAARISGAPLAPNETEFGWAIVSELSKVSLPTLDWADEEPLRDVSVFRPPGGKRQFYYGTGKPIPRFAELKGSMSANTETALMTALDELEAQIQTSTKLQFKTVNGDGLEWAIDALAPRRGYVIASPANQAANQANVTVIVALAAAEPAII